LQMHGLACMFYYLGYYLIIFLSDRS